MQAMTRLTARAPLWGAVCLALALLLAQAGPGLCSEQRQDLQQKLESQKRRLEREKESLSDLTREEERIYSRLVDLQERIKELTKRLGQQEKELKKERQRKKNLERKNKELMRRVMDKRRALRELLPQLWTLWFRSNQLDPLRYQSFEQAERDFTWLASVYGMAREDLASLREERKRLQDNLSRLQKVSEDIEGRLEEIKSTKDDLLQQKLTYVNSLQEIRAQRLAKREQLESIRDTVKDLQYKLRLKRERRISELKGSLTWPAQGLVREDPGDGSSRESEKGLGFSLDDNRRIRAVSWGKVVYEDKLRGFGRVVILFHGQNYYSLYAYLQEAEVKMGQDVEKGEVIGIAGFYPRVDGPGLYFELRRGQSPIDPEPWLGERRKAG